jgi:hypothetical protein
MALSRRGWRPVAGERGAPALGLAEAKGPLEFLMFAETPFAWGFGVREKALQF